MSCVTLPPAPTDGTPVTPAPTPAPPPPAPAPDVPGAPPGPLPPALTIDMENSTITGNNGVEVSFNRCLYNGGFLQTYFSLATPQFFLKIIVQNITQQVQLMNLLVEPDFEQLTVSPVSPVSANVPAANYVIVQHTLTDISSGGGGYLVTVTVGGVVVTLPLGVAYDSP